LGVHSLPALLDQGYAVLETDMFNAFNEFYRDILMKGLFAIKEFRSIHPLAQWSYITPSPLFVMEHGKIIETIMSSNGTRQGCPLGGLVFAAGLHSVLQSAAAVNPNVKMSAYFDDVKFASKNPSDIIAPFLKFEAEAKACGLVVRYPKCKLLWMRDDPLPADIQNFLHERNIPIETQAGIILGAPVGRNADRIQQLVQDIVKEHDRFFALLRHEKLSHQDAFLILSKSGVPRMSYIARCVRPDLIRQPLEDFDDKLLAVATQRISISDDHPKSLAARTQMKLPVRLGGFGLRPSCPYRHFAWLGAFAAASSYLSKSFGNSLPQPLIDSLKTALHQARSHLAPASSARKLLPESAAEATDFFKNHPQNAIKLQKALTSSAEEHAFDRLKRGANVSPADLARLNSLQGAWAGWPANIPFNAALRLSDDHYVPLAKMRLGYPVFNEVPLACRCGKKFADHPLHGLSCVLFDGSLVLARHNEALKVLARWIRLVRGFVRELDYDRWNWGEMRPDLEVIMGLIRELIDVTIRHPTSPVPGAAAAAAVAQKQKLYRELASRVGAQLTPFVIETFGAWDIGAREFVSRIRNFNDRSVTGLSKHDVYYGLSSEVSIAVQRGNARALLACYQSALAAQEIRFSPRLIDAPRALV